MFETVACFLCCKSNNSQMFCNFATCNNKKLNEIMKNNLQKLHSLKACVLSFLVLLTVTFFSSCEKEPTPTPGLPVVSTNEVMEVGKHFAICSATVSDTGDKPINVRGVCWGVNHNPTTGDTFVNSDVYIKCDSIGLGDFKVRLTGLAANVTYYVRAYASTSSGIAYGNELSFTTQSYGSEVPEGAVNALFSINGNGGKVWFSKGNLQYQSSTGTWRFAENQWDVCDVNLSEQHHTSDYAEGSNAWIDLFGWGTSGYNHGAAYYQPWSTSTCMECYQAYGRVDCNLYDETGIAEWGYNAISNGGNAENSDWRTLTNREWSYLMNVRPNASNLYGHGQVKEIKGFIFLPDDWCIPAGFTFTSGISHWVNCYTEEQWLKMEAAGAVFLPAAGMRNGTEMHGYGGFGTYWSSTCYNKNSSCSDSYVFHFGYLFASVGIDMKFYGQSVRLVRPAE